MHRQERLYHKLPVALQHVACSAVGWKIQRARYGAGFDQILSETTRDGELSHGEFVELRDQRLRAFIRHAATTVPYYRNLFRQRRLHPEDFRTLEDLKQLPVIDKHTVRMNIDEFTSEAIPQSDRVSVHTSGTTGAGLIFPTTREALRKQWAVWWRYRLWHGITPGTLCAYFGGRSVVPTDATAGPFWRYNWPARQILFSVYHMSDRTLPAFVDELRRRKPPWIHGYPSAVAHLASFVLQHQVDFGYQVHFLTLGAENVLAHQRAQIARAFGVSPKTHYGLAEAVANISERPNGCLHVDEDFAAAELVNDDGATAARIVGTNFLNYAFPLLRYDTGDLGFGLDEAEDDAIHPGRTLQFIDGREEDYILLADGRKIGRLDHIFKDMVRIQEAQFVQRQPGVANLKLVPSAAYSNDDESDIRREIAARCGNELKVVIEYAQSLERSQSGKLRLVVSCRTEGSHERKGQKLGSLG